MKNTDINNREVIFLGRKKVDDRDCCIYMNTDSVSFVCGHCFGNIIFSGACYSGYEEEEIIKEFENNEIETILNKNDIKYLFNIQNAIEELGHNIKINDERYKKGLELQQEFKEFLRKLKTPEAEDFFQKIIKEEKEYCKNEYDLTDKDIDYIFNEYNQDYQDRAIISYIYNDIEEFGREQLEAYYSNIPDSVLTYFDFETFGIDLIFDDYTYIKLEDGRVVSLSY